MLFNIVTHFHHGLKSPLVQKQMPHELWFTNHSRIVRLPCKGDTLRGFCCVRMLIIEWPECSNSVKKNLSAGPKRQLGWTNFGLRRSADPRGKETLDVLYRRLNP